MEVLTGLAPEITAYISTLETQLQEQTIRLQEQAKVLESQQVRIDRLTDMLIKFQRTMYGQSSEKRKYVLGEDENQLSLFNEVVTVKGSAFFVEIYYRGKLLARHERCYDQHKTIYKLEHYIPLLEERPRAVRNARPVREAGLPQDLWNFSLMLEDPDRSMVQLLRLVVDHGPDKVLAAVRKAFTLRQFSVEVVGYHVTAGDTAPMIPIAGPSVQPVDLTCYDSLLVGCEMP